MFRLKHLVFFLIVLISLYKIEAQQSVPADLSTVKVDDLSDDQIKQLVSKATASGMTIEQMESQALSRGMPSSEIRKLRERIDKLKTGEKETPQQESDRKRKIPTNKGVEKKDELFGIIMEQKITIEDSLKKKIFGFDLFSNEKLTFEPNMNIPTPQNYQLGAGDELIIDIWGASQATYRQTISPEGNILIPNLGPIAVNGLTIEKASQKIIGRLSTIYAGLSGVRPNTFAQVNLGNIRSINISLIGDVTKPGTYTLPSLSSVFNALYVAGGPSLNGTLRNIKIFRENKLINTLDVYDFLINGNQKDNVRLQDQDVIMISPYNIRVEITGEVKRPAIYEMQENETLGDLFKFCGGYTAKAFRSRSELVRSTNKEYKIIDVPQDSIRKVQLHDGDLINIDPILERYENRVEIQGAVFRPGKFQLTDGLTFKGLINKAEGLKGDAFKSRAIIYRTMEDYNIESIPVDLDNIIKGTTSDILLKKDDAVRVFSIFELQEEFKIKIEGEIMFPGEFPYIVNSTLEDVIAAAGGFKQSASLSKIEVSRRVLNSYADSGSSQIAEIFVFNVKKDLSLSDSANKFTLNPFDIISVRRSPSYEEQSVVIIKGEVNFAGTYSISYKNERISDIIRRAGGITNDAYIKGARLERTFEDDVKTRQKLLEQIKEQSKDSIIVEIKEPNQAIGINLEQILKYPHSKHDLVLQDKDIIIIPKQLQTVRLSGSVLYPITARYDKKFGFRKYISLAGGFSNASNKSKSYVIYANGTVDKTNHFLWFNFYPSIEPGAEIVVPKKPEREKITTQESIAIGTGLSSLALIIITVINSLK